MKSIPSLRVVALVGLVTGLLNHTGLSQNSAVHWYTFSIGYASATSPANTMVKSIIGQSFVGSMKQGNSFIESGFLADTLFRSVLVGVDNARGLPTSFSLSQNYPNPFNPITRIRYALPCETLVVLRLYDMLGQVVLTLVDEKQTAGEKEIQLDARGLASGVYVYRLTASDPSLQSVQAFTDVKKLMVIK
jgi:hypothetical protein